MTDNERDEIFAKLDANREEVRVEMEKLRVIAGPIDTTMAVVRRAYAVAPEETAVIHRRILRLNEINKELTSRLCG